MISTVSRERETTMEATTDRLLPGQTTAMTTG
jgi:hypothetical protein